MIRVGLWFLVMVGIRCWVCGGGLFRFRLWRVVIVFWVFIRVGEVWLLVVGVLVCIRLFWLLVFRRCWVCWILIRLLCVVVEGWLGWGKRGMGFYWCVLDWVVWILFWLVGRLFSMLGKFVIFGVVNRLMWGVCWCCWWLDNCWG